MVGPVTSVTADAGGSAPAILEQPALSSLPLGAAVAPDPGELAYRVINDAETARRAVADLAERGVPVGLDIETTGLDPLAADARLVQLAPEDEPVTIIDLAKAGGLA